MAVTHKLALDVHKRTPVGQQRVVVRQGEAGTQQIEAAITKDGEPYASSCTGARLEVLHADGTWARVTAAKSGSTVTCTLPSAALSSHGTCKLAYFAFFTGTSVVETTEGFELRVLPAIDVSGEMAKPYDDLLTKLWEKWDAYEKQAEKQESARVSAENARKSQESARVSAEQHRVTEHASLKTASQQATSSANSAASSANSAASRASGAADDATAAATNALNIANSIASIKPPSDAEVEELRKADEILASAVAELQDKYVLIGETAYAPSNRITSYSGETLALAQSSVSGETATLN